MKLRQKFAAVLATAMVITSVPVVTMAASTNSLTRETIKLAKNDITTTNSVKVDFKDSAEDQVEVFYLELENAKWDFSELAEADGTVEGKTVTFTGKDFTYEKQSDTIVKVTATVDATKKAQFPIMAKATGGDAKVSVSTKGGNTTVSNGTFVFATTSDANAIVTAETKNLPTLYTDGKIADIIITESMKGAFAALKDDATKIELTIDNDDFRFVSGSGTVEFTYGFAGQENSISAVSAVVNTKDKQTMVVTLPKTLKSDSIGQIKITGIEVESTVKAPETGDLTVTVDGDAVKATESLKVATISEYGSEITVAEDDKVAIKAGDQKEVIFTLKETEKTSFINGRDVEFTIDKGFFMNQVEDKDGDYDEDATLTAVKAAIKVENTENDEPLTITEVTVEDEKVVGFTARMIATDNADKIKVTAKITAGLEEEGDVTVKAAGRALAKEVSGVITNITKVVSVNTEAAVLKVGLQGQEAGKIVLTEAEKAMFKSGSKIEITVPVENGITVAAVPTVKVTDGDIQMDKATLGKVNKDDKTVTITIPVKRTSKTASTIEISNIEFTTDRTVAEGSFDVTLGGTALSPEKVKETIKLNDFLVIGTPNTEDITASNGLAKGTAGFVIGEATYTANGTTKEMDAKSYIQDPGFTMVPVRYVAEAFGVKASDILFSNGTATIFAGNRTIQLTAGSNVAIVNGASVTMGTKVVVKEGRTYAPVGEIARILGISTNWDSATKTATFENK